MVRVRTGAIVAACLTGTVLVASCGANSDGATEPSSSLPASSAESVEGSDNAAPKARADVPATLRFEATTVDGVDFDAADLAGQPVMFWFWAPWCSTCAAQSPHVAEIASAFGDDLAVVGVASLGDRSAMQDFIERTGTGGFVHLNDETGDVWRHFEITEQSTFALLDSDGVVQYAGYIDPDDLEDYVVEITR